jgi:hypothetical protein
MIFKNSCADCAATEPLRHSIRNALKLNWPFKFAVYERARVGVRKIYQKRSCSQQALSAVEQAGYKRHSLPLLRRIAHVLDADIVVALVPRKAA